MTTVGCVLLTVMPLAATSPKIDYALDVQPLFRKACYACHGPEKQKAGLRLDRKHDALLGGESGTAIVPGKPAESLLLKLIAGDDADRAMPPKKDDRLTAAQIAMVRAWIEQGAVWPDDASKSTAPAEWWSLKPIATVTPPAMESNWIRNPIDAFVLAKQREKNLTPAPEADRRTLIRRLSFDLIGLPPTPEQIEAFEKDTAADAYEKMVDRFLADDGYGERWARHWLDVVHYGDTHGYDKDQPRPNAYPYRDYVIRSFNTDKRYDRFVREQIAGDVIAPGTLDGLTALGFLAAGPWDLIGHAEVPETKIDGKIARHLDRDDMVSNTFGTFVSLTVHCAQCHNHKFDPISLEEYYRLQAVFAAIDRTDKSFDLNPDVARKRQTLEIQRRSAEWLRIAGVPVAVAAVLHAQMESQKLPPLQRVYSGTVHYGSGAFAGTGGRPRPIRILPRGDVTRPGKDVMPGAIAAVSGVDANFSLRAGHHESERRLALANWIADSQNPFTWRSIVNRVWQYHFGRGIVATPNDFGRMGLLPSHPELLDWLAANFRDGNQSLKQLHRLIVTSATYRQSAAVNPAAEKLDPENQFLSRQNRRKLDAEAVRDAILTVAGRLDRTMYGPAFQDFQVKHPEHSPHYEYDLHDPNDPKCHRRSIYRFLVRSKQQPFMVVLDCADPSMQVDKRNETLSPLQALALMNNKLVLVMAKHLAARVEKAGDPVATAVTLALGRLPSAAEKTALTEYSKTHGLPAACRVILNMNEFAFVD